MEKNKQLVPKRRFKEFENDGEWEQYIVKDIFRITRGDVLAATKTTEVKTPSMPYPVYSSQTKNNGLMGYYKDFLYEDAIAWTTDGANAGTVSYRQGKFYCTNVSGVLLSDKGFANKMVSESLNKVAWKHVSKVGNPKLMNNVMGEITISIPNKIEEQRKIASFITNLDELISHNQYKVKRLKDLKSAYLSDMFPKEGGKYPKKRFEGFTEPWEKYEVGNLMGVTSVKRVHQSDWRDSGVRFLRARDIVSASKNEEPSDYLYISQEKYDEYSIVSGKVSPGDLLVTGVGTIGVPYLIKDSAPLYFKDGNIIWFKNNSLVYGPFLYYSFVGPEIQKFVQISAGTGTVGTYTIDSGRKTPLLLPSKKEQIKIGNFFKNLDAQINLEEQKLNKLEQLKQAYLNELFV